MVTHRKHKHHDEAEHWLNEKWRPMMGWMYMAICTFDFMVAPILWSLLQAKDHGMVNSQWQPLTLQGAGLFHLAMGAVLGITAYGRTQEKMNSAPAPMSFPQGSGTTYQPPSGSAMQVNNNNMNPGFGSPAPMNNSFGSPAPMNNSFGSPAPMNNSFGSPAPMNNSFPAAPSTFNPPPLTPTPFISPMPAPAPVVVPPTPVVTGYAGKKAPTPLADPSL